MPVGAAAPNAHVGGFRSNESHTVALLIESSPTKKRTTSLQAAQAKVRRSFPSESILRWMRDIVAAQLGHGGLFKGIMNSRSRARTTDPTVYVAEHRTVTAR